MRSVILSTLLLVLAVCTVSAQNRNTSICRLGFTYDISQSKNWGNNKPVIKSIILIHPPSKQVLRNMT